MKYKSLNSYYDKSKLIYIVNLNGVCKVYRYLRNKRKFYFITQVINDSKMTEKDYKNIIEELGL